MARFFQNVVRGFRNARNTQIEDGGTAPLESQFPGARFVLNRGDGAQTTDAPLVTIDDARGTVTNRGEASSLGQTATVSFQADGGRLFNARGASIEAENTGVEVTGEARIVNQGTISGDVNAVNFVNGGQSTGSLVNQGTISSDSRGVNIGGQDIRVVNQGTIVGTGDQRNGTVYSDATAEDVSIVNARRGVIDAGEGNDGAGIALETGDVAGDVVHASVVNQGVVQGRGQAAANVGQAGDGIRLFTTVEGAVYSGNIVNSGTIASESAQGPTAGLRIANGLSFEGTIANSGAISGVNNGLYFGTGSHDARVVNSGTISSDSRAVNIDGTGVDLINAGHILGTDDQRNGTVYADSTADDYSVTNLRRGVIDAGHGNDGSGVSLQTGEVDGDTVTASVSNAGTIRGRGDAVDGNGIGDGVRIFSGQDGVTFDGGIQNTGLIEAASGNAAASAIRVEDGVSVTGQIVNRGTLRAEEIAIDATDAGGDVRVVNSGRIEGEVALGAGDDTFDGSRSRFDTEVDGGAGADVLKAGRGDDDLTGGLGDDVLSGGRGEDTARFDDADVAVTVDLNAGRAVRETGFRVEVEDGDFASLTTGQSPAQLVEEALAGNLYFNVHTQDFPGGEIRGQLSVASEGHVDGARVIRLEGALDASQEPGPLSDSDATGFGTVTLTVRNGHVTYDSTLEVSGLTVDDLLPVAGVSPIHLHNAPSGVNGPVITDIVQDAGGDVNGQLPNGGDVFAETAETDRLVSIENAVGSNDGDTIIAGRGDNVLTGNDGNDVFVFGARGGRDTVTDFEAGDQLDLSAAALGFDDFADLSHAIRQVGEDAVIDLGRHDSVTLEDVQASTLTSEDFIL